MKLSEKVKNKIIAEYEKWLAIEKTYLTKELKKECSAFFTPPELTLKLLEKLDTKPDDTLLDPCLGAGGLLAAAIISGKVKAENCYGIELDTDILQVAKKRLGALGVPEWHLHHGNALNSDCYDFSDDYTYDAATDTVTFESKVKCKSMRSFGMRSVKR